jgi:hypothetical protein
MHVFSVRVLFLGRIRGLFGQYRFLYTILADDLADIVHLDDGTGCPFSAALGDALLSRCQYQSHSQRALLDCEIHLRVHVRLFFLCDLCCLPLSRVLNAITASNFFFVAILSWPARFFVLSGPYFTPP